MSAAITDAERPWLEDLSLRRQADLIVQLRSAGYPNEVTAGILGWLVVKVQELPDQTTGSTRARYRKILAALPPSPPRRRTAHNPPCVPGSKAAA